MHENYKIGIIGSKQWGDKGGDKPIFRAVGGIPPQSPPPTRGNPEQYSQATTHLICKQAIFAQNASIVFSSNNPVYIETNPVEKLCEVLEIKLKTYAPVGPIFVFEKIKFKVLHYI